MVKGTVKRKGTRGIVKWVSGFVLLASVMGFLGGFVFWTLSDMPRIKQLEEYSPLESSLVYSSDNELLAELFVERRTFVPYYKIPAHVKNAFIAVEDNRFYKHRGIDFVRVFGALLEDIKAMGFVQGGSTITQQLAKMLFLKPDRSIARKVKEAALSIQIERHYTKDEILGLYLNQAYFGTRAYGIEAAAFTYFGKTTENLSVAEAALMAAIPKAPSVYSPFKNPAKALNRRNYAIRKMYENGFITKTQYDDALKTPLPTLYNSRRYKAPYFIDYIRNELEDRYGDKLFTSGIKIHTTLNYRLQTIAETAATNGINAMAKRGKKNVQVALIAIELNTGAIKAMVGGTDFWNTQFNRVTQARRQPGSAFKPIVYLTAFNQGMTPDDTILDEEISFPGKNKADVWVPRNYKRVYNGVVTLRYALSQSLNAATVSLGNKVGLKNVLETAQEIGINSKIQPYMPSCLGASELTVIELAYAYCAIATGKRFDNTTIERIVDRDGITLDEFSLSGEDIIDDTVVDKMRDVLGAVVQEGTGRKALVLNRPVYGKTGTTDDYTDAWFMGFDDNYIVGVWVGRDNHKPIGDKETGAVAALPIWIDFMSHL
ncbi:MAG: PBP1A family penicillin-binding protein [Nitrospirae bacterium]|uniref:transglycosylase domain-containing protein n=1 Tax=Candidatus Magnetobacterium casense TaxID=1455061 RepID=UPI00069600AF|nr:PBP1A family penicillin-binding protein [Candidatus Magnetobacterium casensis]MBF0338431.1 PBP1A family penicillin-binding protein [Nitrospirota bacterium]